jgi:hypothetical protein
MAHSQQTARPEQPANSAEHLPHFSAEVAHASARVNGVELHYAHAGSGPLAEERPELVTRSIREHLARVTSIA